MSDAPHKCLMMRFTCQEPGPPPLRPQVFESEVKVRVSHLNGADDEESSLQERPGDPQRDETGIGAAGIEVLILCAKRKGA